AAGTDARSLCPDACARRSAGAAPTPSAVRRDDGLARPGGGSGKDEQGCGWSGAAFLTMLADRRFGRPSRRTTAAAQHALTFVVRSQEGKLGPSRQVLCSTGNALVAPLVCAGVAAVRADVQAQRKPQPQPPACAEVPAPRADLQRLAVAADPAEGMV